jgi:hypothetical protein
VEAHRAEDAVKIPTGDFGFRTARTAPGADVRANVTPGAFVSGTGQALEKVGSTLADISQEVTKARRAAELQDRVGKATMELADLELSFDRDQDFLTAPDRFKEKAEALRKKHLGEIGDNAVRGVFDREFQKLSLAKFINVKKGAAKRETDHNIASLDTNLEVYASSAAQAKTEQERAIVLGQARLSIQAMKIGGWIDEVEAGKRERGFLARLDDHMIRRDIAAAPEAAADRLAIDPNYAPNVDPSVRQRWIDTAYRRAETERVRLDAAEKKRREERGNELLSASYTKLADGKLTREEVDAVRPFVSPAEYKGLLDGWKNQGQASEDDSRAYAELQAAIYRNPRDAAALAFSHHKAGRIKDATLGATLAKVRELERSEGPRSPYERNRGFITSSLEPSAATQDPAPRARQGLAIKEFDDWFDGHRRATGKDPEDAAIEAKAKEVVGRFALIDMNELARSTGLGSRNDPAEQLKQVQARAEKLLADREAKKIAPAEFNRKMADLNKLRQAAEKALANGRP